MNTDIKNYFEFEKPPLTFEEYRNALIYNQFYNYWHRYVVIVVVVTLILTAYALYIDASFFYILILCSLASLIGLLITVPTDLLNIQITAKKDLKNADMFKRTVKVTATENGFLTESERGQGEIYWKDFKSRIETKKLFILRMHTRMIVIFPKRIFNENTLTSFSNAIKENIKKKSISICG